MTMLTSKRIRTTALVVASCFPLLIMPSFVEAAGMGRIKVLTGLGEPLRAEIDVIANKEELQGMAVHLASPEAFEKVGIEYSQALSGVRFSIEKRSSGQPYVLVQSDRPLNDPFINLLVELDWPTGRLMREYHFLLNPPEITLDQTAGRPLVEPPKVASVEDTTASSGFLADASTSAKEENIDKSSVSEKKITEEPASKRTTTKKPPVVQDTSTTASALVTSPTSSSPSSSHVVQKGETLSQIAIANKYPDATLEQMLVAIYRANQNAFIDGNMNLLKSGRTLTIPDQNSINEITEKEARQVTLTHSSDWDVYRRKLAEKTSPTSTLVGSETTQTGSGKIGEVRDKSQDKTASGDVVSVSSTSTELKAIDDFRTEVIIATKAKEEAEGRVSELTDITEKQKSLLTLKDKQIADLQNKLDSFNSKSADKQPPVEQVTPKQPPVEQVTPKQPPVEQVTPKQPPVEQVTPEQPQPPQILVDEKVAEEVAPVAPKTDKPKTVKPPPPLPTIPQEPADEESNTMMLGILGGAVVLGGGLIAWFMRRRTRQVEGDSSTSASMIDDVSNLSGSSIGVNSVFRSTGGQHIDTSSNYSRPHTDFSQAGPGQIDTDEVDPVAEADVYMAYGRDPQAEEILLEALQKEPRRLAIHLKLLEIYSLRGNLKQFETLATELYEITGGTGSDWEKAAVMGSKLDPKNPLYGNNKVVSPRQKIPPSVHEVEADDYDKSTDIGQAGRTTVAMPGKLGYMADVAATPVSEIQSAFDESSVLDFGPSQQIDEYQSQSEAPSDFSFDLDASASELDHGHSMAKTAPFGGIATTPTPQPKPAKTEKLLAETQPERFDNLTVSRFDQNMTSSVIGALSTNEPVSTLDDELNFDLTTSEVLGSLGETSINQPVSPGMGATGVDSSFHAFDLGNIDLDLDKNDSQDGQDEASTKLDLAKAYEDMGDVEGARELLQEVINEGTVEQKKTAQATLKRLADKF